MSDDLDRVVPLDDLDDFEIADGEPDVRGWEVLGADGRTIGQVDELLIDTSAMKVRYLDVDLDDRLGGDDNEDRHILIPIGYAKLHETDNQVLIDGLSSTDVSTLPAYTHEPVTREYERMLRSTFDRDYTASSGGDEADFYAHDVFDQNRFFGRRGTEERGGAGAGGSHV